MGVPQGPLYIDDVLTFTVVTHRFDTGALTDADSVPAYRIYEDETGTAILNGSMAKLDDANTTGFYSEQITLSAANGFETGKSYAIYVTAAVNSVTGGQTFNFKVAGPAPAVAGVPKVDITHIAGAAVSTTTAQLGVNAVQVSGSATAADNVEVVFATDFATNYDTTLDRWQVDVDMISTDATAADNLELFFDGTGYNASTSAIGTVATATAVTTVNGFAANSITAAAIANGAIDAATFAADVDAEILSYLVDDATRIDASALNTATGTTIPAIVADTNELQTDWADGGRLDLILDARASQASVDTIDGIVDAILVDTAEIGVAGAGLTNINLPDQTMNITGNITGNLSGSVGSVSGNVGGTINGLTATALADFFDTDSTKVFADAVSGSVVAEIANNAGGSSLTVQDIVDGVWDEDATGHQTQGTFGQVLGDTTGAGGSIVSRLPAALTNGSINANVTQISGDSTAADNCELFFDGNGYNASTSAIGTVATATAVTTVNGIAANVVNASALAADAVTEIQSGLATASALSTVEGKIDTIDTVVDGIKVTTDKLDDTLEDDGGTFRFTANALEEAPTGGSAPTAEEIRDAILSDSTPFAGASIAAIKAKTDPLTFTVANQVDSNIQYVNDVQVTGNGQTGTEWGPA